MPLCDSPNCRLLLGHHGNHDFWPTKAWCFFAKKDAVKLTKAGLATPRGGAKGGYQNHVNRSSKVVIPYEKLEDVDLASFQEGYVIRLFPEQYFKQIGVVHDRFLGTEPAIIVGENAFVLYRSHLALENYPPLPDWRIRTIHEGNNEVNKRSADVTDVGHYILRQSTSGALTKTYKGPPQGIFSPEYADKETNYLCQVLLAWLIVQTDASPYTTAQAAHLKLILEQHGMLDAAVYERNGVLRHGLSCCPLCTKVLKYEELHQTISFADEDALANAAMQDGDSTRSTIVNLFHLRPLEYSDLLHIPENVAWGHALCNTKLGQRNCYSLAELQDMNQKVGIVKEKGIETFGWMSIDWKMIRSATGAVWIQIVKEGDLNPEDTNEVGGDGDGDDEE